MDAAFNPLRRERASTSESRLPLRHGDRAGWALRSYRLAEARKLGKAAFHVFSNKQLN